MDDGVSRRLKALACTAPLHDPDARKARLDWCDASRYQMAEIALAAIDQVTLAMDFDHGADQAQVVRRLRPFVAAQHPHAPPGEHERVPQWVIENLINVGSVDRGFRADYGSVTPESRYDADLRAGRKYLSVDDRVARHLAGLPEPDGTGLVAAARVFRRPEPVAP